MDIRKFFNHHFKIKALVTGYLLGNIAGAGAVLNVPDTPIFLANDIQANIFFALDDSGSMDWEVTKSNGALAAHPFSPNSGNLDFSPNDHNEDREFCAGYNVLAYDPNVTYQPWFGVDEDGNAYVDQPINAALTNPYDANGGTRNLLNADGTGFAVGYGLWVDGSGGNPADGVYQDGECPIAPDPGFQGYGARAPTYTDVRWIFVDTLTAAEQTNFANWYSYYRKREYVLKRAVSELITNSTQRMGLATLHNNNDVGTPVADMTNTASKDTLLDELFQINSTGGTPLRRLLENTGEYFDDTDGDDNLHSPLGFTDSTPILSAADGGECQQNFTVLFSDGFWNGGNPSVGNTDADGTGEWDGGPHADTFSNTLADVAMKFYEEDLSSLTDSVPVITNIDENQQQHMVTYAVAFGIDGTLSDADIPVDHNATTAPPPWPQPTANALTTTDDMRHAAFNSRGLYLAGQDPQSLISSLNDALTDIGNRTGSASAVAATSQAVQSDTLIFQGFFDTENWDGELFGIRLNADGSVGATQWRASENIPVENSRDIFTWVNDGTTLGAEFEWANLTTAQQTTIGSQAVVDYVRGDQSNEVQNGGTLRNRDNLLGDIIHSAPVSVTKAQSPPPYQFLPGTEGTSFNAYLQTKQSRVDMVYVGANDGMLHGIRTDNGVEEFAYVPQGVFGDLQDLTSTSYAHKFFVDGEMAAGDAYVSGAWRAVLAGTLGRGGNTVFALDVSDPTGFAASDVLWEYTHSELGLTIGRPQIVRLNNGAWAVIVGNGYNSTSEQAQLFVIDLASGAIIKRFNTLNGSASNPNGLATPLLVDTNFDFTIDYAYAGDLRGNVWKFDLSDTDPNNWSISFSGSPLYTAIAPDGSEQPITTKPGIVSHPMNGYLILFGTGRFFVQGDDLVPTTPQVQSFYGVWDQGATVSSVGTRAFPGSGSQPNTILQPQEIVEENEDTFDTVDQFTRELTQNNVDYNSVKGWYIDFYSPNDGAQGERLVSDPVVTIGERDTPLIVFNTFVPQGGCESTGGFSYLWAFDAVYGNRTDFPVFDLNRDGDFSNSDAEEQTDGTYNQQNVWRRPATIAPPRILSNTDATKNFGINSNLDGSIDVIDINGLSRTLGRQSWRQLK